jgi:hypothetical protein
MKNGFKLSRFGLFLVLFLVLFAHQLWANESYSKQFIRYVPSEESKTDFGYEFDGKDNLYILDTKKEQVRVYDSKNSLIRRIDWGVQNKGKGDKDTFRFDVDNKGDLTVWTLGSPSFVYDDKGSFVGEFTFKNSEWRIFDHLRFFNGVLYSEMTGELVYQVDKSTEMKKGYCFDDFQIDRSNSDSVVDFVKLTNKKTGDVCSLPLVEDFNISGVDAIDNKGNVYVSYLSDEDTEDGPKTSYKTLKLDAGLKIVSWFEGRIVPDRATLNYYDLDRSDPNRYAIYKWILIKR